LARLFRGWHKFEFGAQRPLALTRNGSENENAFIIRFSSQQAGLSEIKNRFYLNLCQHFAANTLHTFRSSFGPLR